MKLSCLLLGRHGMCSTTGPPGILGMVVLVHIGKYAPYCTAFICPCSMEREGLGWFVGSGQTNPYLQIGIGRGMLLVSFLQWVDPMFSSFLMPWAATPTRICTFLAFAVKFWCGKSECKMHILCKRGT